MCLILDANKYGDFLNPNNQDMQPVRDWIHNRNGKIVYSPTKKMEKELNRLSKMRAQFAEYRRAGKLKQIPTASVCAAKKKLPNLQSDDPHIIALAIAAKVKLLVSSDQNLHADFKNKDLVGGKVYQNKTHQRLLRNDTCP